MKYRKFEEWMIGKFVTYGSYRGKVVEGYESDDSFVYVLWELDVEALAELIEELNFVEEAENMQVEIDWQVGQEVWDIIYGKGVVKAVDNVNYPEYPIHVLFDRHSMFEETSKSYTVGGSLAGSSVRSLFFSQPVVTAELYPPKKPFTPTLKEGECVLLWSSEAHYPKFVTILKEGETAISYLENGQEQRSYKQGIKIKRIGEEVKL